MKALLALGVAAAAFHDVDTQAVTGIERVAWLQGCWATSTTDRVVEEQWMGPRGGSMMGMSRTVRAGKLLSYETTVIREQGEALAFQAHPSGQPAATFVSTRVTPSAIVFENSAHDFPQQVGYRTEG